MNNSKPREWFVEAVGNDPTQAYLCAGVLQTLELSIAQHLHKSFSKITRQCRLYDSNGYIRETKRCPNAPTVCYSRDQCEFLVPRDGYAPSSDDYQSSVFLLNYPGKIRWENTRRSIDIFNQRTSVLIQLFPPSIHSIPYWTDFLS